eukprot:Cvel_32861.t1-p1 / transcript=Cvel_32861.t1 / gene=Cvel_32861 / organism=Chromera_velia_CCMP2878 / gene_product=Calcium-dependent protein kinase 2, putative / transcript_product=Calcium-dependent protein kinase 2, putative / location=Cvel_scaffold5206:3376-5449(+) / protein_length=404 / sequence_SO=supercontig / SO=protein_coding / is_pseudo=false
MTSTVQFQCSCGDTKPGESVFVVGSSSPLGSWFPDRAYPLRTTATEFPKWTSAPLLHDPQSSVEFKFIVRRDGSTDVRWEPIGGNRSFSLAFGQSLQVGAEWGDEGSLTVTNLEVDYSVRTPVAADIPVQASYQMNAPLVTKNSLALSPGLDTSPAGGSGCVPACAPKEMLTPRRRRMDRQAFILSSSGSMSQFYRQVKKIGQGTWGAVHEVVHKTTGALRAAKVIPKVFVEDIDRFRQEIELMKSLDHPNIVRLYETFEDQADIYLVMEYCAGGELFDRLLASGSFSELDACRLMNQILAGVAYCHKLRVVHRDLKPENFLFLLKDPNSPIKLIDFGLASRYTPGQLLRTRAGTPYYVSPQVLEGRYGPECDVWSAGVMMYILLCGYPPFNGPTDTEIMERVR